MNYVAIGIASMATASLGLDAVAVYVNPPTGSAVDEEGEKDNPKIVVARQNPRTSSFRAVLLRRLGAALIALLVVGIVYLEVHTTAAELAAVVWHSPKGALSSPAKLLELAGEVKKVADGRMGSVTLLIVVVYLTLQTFCIPGTIFLNVVTGALLGVRFGLPLCVVLGTIGASACYGLSALAGMRLATAVDKRLMKGEGIGILRSSVQRYRKDLFAYLLFLRLTPLLPNWLINLGSPVAAVPYGHFAIATLLGITPQTYLSVRFGTVAQSGTIKTIVTWGDTAAIAGIGVVVLVAVRLRARFSQQQP